MVIFIFSSQYVTPEDTELVRTRVLGISMRERVPPALELRPEELARGEGSRSGGRCFLALWGERWGRIGEPRDLAGLAF
jgi:hypothetical protein